MSAAAPEAARPWEPPIGALVRIRRGSIYAAQSREVGTVTKVVEVPASPLAMLTGRKPGKWYFVRFVDGTRNTYPADALVPAWPENSPLPADARRRRIFGRIDAPPPGALSTLCVSRDGATLTHVNHHGEVFETSLAPVKYRRA